MTITIRKKLYSGLLGTAVGTAMLFMLPYHIKAKVSRFTAAVGPDYLPTLVSWLMIGCGVLLILSSFKKEETVAVSLGDEGRVGLYALLLLMYVLLIVPLGFLLASMLGVAASLYLMEDRKAAHYLWTELLVVGVWAAFTYFLKVPLP